MKKRMINDEELIINLNDKYYVVNEYTYNLLQHYYSCKDLEELAKKLNLSLRKTRKIYTNLKEEIDNVDYYDNNIDAAGIYGVENVTRLNDVVIDDIVALAKSSNVYQFKTAIRVNGQEYFNGIKLN